MRIQLIIHFLFYTICNVCCEYEYTTSTYLNILAHEGVQRTSISCQHALKLLFKRLDSYDTNDDDMWALKMMDSTSDIPTGLLSQNFYNFGNFDQCIEIKSKRDYITGKYCMANMFVNKSTINNPSKYLKKHTYLRNLITKVYEDTKNGSNIKWAFCLPSNCSNKDAFQVINATDILGFSVSSVNCQTAEDAYPTLDEEGLIGITIFGIIFLLVAASTLIDLYYSFIQTAVYKRTKKINQQDIMKEPLIEPIENSTEHQNDNLKTKIVKSSLMYANNNLNDKVATKNMKLSEVKPIYLVFSLHSNSKILFGGQSRSSGLSCLDGLRVLSMLWILSTHLFMVYYPFISGLNHKYVLNYTSQLQSTFFIGGALGCDTFLLVGGTLVTYLFFKKDGKNLNTIKGILKYYLHRYIRLTPALLGVILFTITTFKYVDSGPKWIEGTTEMRESCKQYWWSALLHLQNQINVDKMCIRHSWYINVDMQLYLVSPIILNIFKKNAKIGSLVVTVAALASVGLYYWRELYDERSGAHSTNPFGVFDRDYYKTETRAAPWLMGTILGYLLSKKEYQNYKISKKYLIPLWILSLTLMVLVVLASQPAIRNSDNFVQESALYIAVSRPLFAIGVAWVIWACATNNGGVINSFLSLPVFNLLNKSIYSIYLIHLMVLLYKMFNMRSPIYFSMFELAFSYCGLVLLTFVISIFWVLIFESPMMALEKIILP